MDFGLKGKRAIVTGGNSGIGLEVARVLAAEGVHLALAARNQARLSAAASEISAAFGVQATPFSYDIEAPEQVDEMVQSAAGVLGGIDILVNNGVPAGAGGTSVARLTDDYVAHHLATKAMGYFRCSRAVVPHMEAQQGGRIVNVAGMAARHASAIPGGMRNAAVTAMSKVASMDLGRYGIVVTTVHPGAIHESPLVGRWHHPTTRDVANIVGFLCSSHGACLTGESIGVAAGGIG